MTVLRFAIVAAWPLLIEATLLTMWSRATKELPELGLMMPACTMAFHLAALRFFPNRGRGWWLAERVSSHDDMLDSIHAETRVEFDIA